MKALLAILLALLLIACTQPAAQSVQPAAQEREQNTSPQMETAPAIAAPATHTDLTALPLGGKLASAPTRGAIYNCRNPDTNGGGAQAAGPWIHGSTYDLTAKEHVHGSVAWPQQMSIVLEGATRVVSGNALPKHATGVYPVSSSDPAYQYDRNPNKIAAQTYELRLPANPVAATPSCIGGEVGVSLSGSPIFDGLDAEGRDAVAYEVQDNCSGHPERSGTYHYHSVSACVDAGNHALVGYALDGYGIYGHRHENGSDVTNTDLDECHGHTHTILWDGKNVSMYHYHATWEYPYTVGCFHAKPAAMQVVKVTSTTQGTGQTGPSSPPDLAVAAAKLGISEDTLKRALGPPPPDLAAAAAKLGITEAELKSALDAS